MKRPISIAFAAALLVSVTTLNAHSEILLIDPTSTLAQQAVAVALPEFEARDLDRERYSTVVYTRDSAVYVIFKPRDLLDEDDDSKQDFTLEVILTIDARRVVDAYFAR